MWNRNLILHPSLNFMLLNVLISLLTRLRLKIFITRLLHLGWFPRDYRAVVHEENWANCPFKRKLYFISDGDRQVFHGDMIIVIRGFFYNYLPLLNVIIVFSR